MTAKDDFIQAMIPVLERESGLVWGPQSAGTVLQQTLNASETDLIASFANDDLGKTILAYYWLRCNSEKAQEIASDLRLGLAMDLCPEVKALVDAARSDPLDGMFDQRATFPGSLRKLVTLLARDGGWGEWTDWLIAKADELDAALAPFAGD